MTHGCRGGGRGGGGVRRRWRDRRASDLPEQGTQASSTLSDRGSKSGSGGEATLKLLRSVGVSLRKVPKRAPASERGGGGGLAQGLGGWLC